jgi:lipid II isoglutaminyl synthase (glutamine-hydrolysing)
MGISDTVRCKSAESAGKLAKRLVKMGKGMGKSFPGYVYLEVGSMSCVPYLARKPEIGSIIITGTNGKTTTTKITALLLGKDTKITYNYDSNTLNAIITGLLEDNINLGIFEYGIRDKKNAIPDVVSRLVDPIGVVYTNISREHSLVAGRKNPFKEYIEAKKLLSDPMERGIVICNADDPRTTYIGKDKEEEIRVTYFGLDLDLEDHTEITGDIFCPICKENLVYSKRYLNHRGLYQCSCGFSRPEPDLKLTKLIKKDYVWQVSFKGDTYNYSTEKNVSLNFEVNLPVMGVHNLYNLLCAVTIYASFTPHPEQIRKTVEEVCGDLNISILPPGRFEIFEIGEKLVGMGQGDNGDALKANIQFMMDYVPEDMKDHIEFIYTTPDEGEDDIFVDHLSSLISLNPKKVYVVPGRESVFAAEKYYDIIKESLEAEFYPLSHEEMDKRIKKIVELIRESSSGYIVVSGCGPEHYMWAELKSMFKSL